MPLPFQYHTQPSNSGTLNSLPWRIPLIPIDLKHNLDYQLRSIFGNWISEGKLNQNHIRQFLFSVLIARHSAVVIGVIIEYWITSHNLLYKSFKSLPRPTKWLNQDDGSIVHNARTVFFDLTGLKHP